MPFGVGQRSERCSLAEIACFGIDRQGGDCWNWVPTQFGMTLGQRELIFRCFLGRGTTSVWSRDDLKHQGTTLISVPLWGRVVPMKGRVAWTKAHICRPTDVAETG